MKKGNYIVVFLLANITQEVYDPVTRLYLVITIALFVIIMIVYSIAL